MGLQERYPKRDCGLCMTGIEPAVCGVHDKHFEERAQCSALPAPFTTGTWEISPPISMAVMKPKLINPTAETFLRNEARGWFRASSQAWTLAVNLSKHERYIGQAISSGPLQCALGVSVRTEPRPWGLSQPVREDTLLCARGSVTTTGMRS